jgi:hypothetical protein
LQATGGSGSKAQQSSGLQIHQLIGQGSLGSVWLGGPQLSGISHSHLLASCRWQLVDMVIFARAVRLVLIPPTGVCWLLSGDCFCCCAGTWHGKRVACKIMQLPASGPFASQGERAPAALMAQNQANSPPHMAIMEVVLSSTVSHPNVSRHDNMLSSPVPAAARSAASLCTLGLLFTVGQQVHTWSQLAT